MERKQVEALMQGFANGPYPFYSEADFQHQLAWKIRQFHPAWNVSLELPVPTPNGRIHVDILVEAAGSRIGLELKYKTTILQVPHTDGGLNYDLAHHGAHPLGRYDILKDIERLQILKREKIIDRGFSIAITNDQTYWTDNAKQDGWGSNFLLTEGRNIEADRDLIWQPGFKTASTGKNRQDAVKLLSKVKIEWQPFTLPIVGKNSTFRYLLVAV